VSPLATKTEITQQKSPAVIPVVPHRRRAVEFFEFQDDDKEGEGEGGEGRQETREKMKEKKSSAPSKVSTPQEVVDDGLVYSRVHGYRIKADHHEDTSLAYKKVLGDIKVCLLCL
jgi:hypothetical protein